MMKTNISINNNNKSCSSCHFQTGRREGGFVFESHSLPIEPPPPLFSTEHTHTHIIKGHPFWVSSGNSLTDKSPSSVTHTTTHMFVVGLAKVAHRIDTKSCVTHTHTNTYTTLQELFSPSPQPSSLLLGISELLHLSGIPFSRVQVCVSLVEDALSLSLSLGWWSGLFWFGLVGWRKKGGGVGEKCRQVLFNELIDGLAPPRSLFGVLVRVAGWVFLRIRHDTGNVL